VPDIIRFSNNLCYGGEIRALREASSARVKPALVVHEVPGGRAVDKINIQEASEIANLIVAMCGMPEYDSCTIGVICMVGTEQALLIDSLLRKRLPASQYQRHRLLCGNASQFQGDERDVIFLSMVDSPRPGKRLVLRTRDDQRKVFNVAASRARDQLWVVHSLDPERDLKEGDLRLQLISYAENPGTHTDRASKRERIPTDLEKELYTALRRLNYDVTLHGKVGEYTLDLIVAGDGGARVAIQCDGGRLLDSEQIEEAIERQQTLERLGWRFVRIRASRFFLDREAEFNKLCERLRELDVRRGTGIGKIAPMRGPADNLKDRVLARAAELSRRELRNRSGLTGTDD
jgi:very-short-patch-repair endonuclease